MNKEVKFLHFRQNDRNGNISNMGGGTVAYRVTDEGLIEYAVSWCSPKDNFNKSYGRAKAAGRLVSERFCSLATETNVAEFRKNVHEDVYGF